MLAYLNEHSKYAYRIAALHDGMTVGEIAGLSLPQRTASSCGQAYAESHPKSGRPYPKSTAKKIMLEARADASQFLPTRG